MWNGLLWGRKLWALLPPAKSSFSPAGEHPLDSRWYRAWQARREADGKPHGDWLFAEQRSGDVMYVPPSWGHATLNLEESLSIGGFLQDDATLALHMQILHAPRGVGSLQNAATLHVPWYEQTARAFSLPRGADGS